MKKVSVILTTYNSEDCIQRTISSIFKQKGINKKFTIELLVIDDCSTDNTTKILKTNNISFLKTQKNSGGPNKGRNIGLQAATGDYICITDHDDEWKEHRIMTLLIYLEKAPIVTSGFTVINTKYNTSQDRLNKGDEFIFHESNKLFFKRLTRTLKGSNFYLGSVIFHKKLKNILFEEHFGMLDFDWGLRLLHNNSSVEVLESLFNRYVDGTNLSFNESYRRINYYYSLMYIENYKILYPKEVEIAYKRINGNRARYHYVMNDMGNARFYFLKSGFNWKVILYYFTTFGGSEFVKKKFNVFG